MKHRTKHNQIDRQMMRMLRDAIETTLAGLGQEHGVKFRVANGRFDSQTASFKLMFDLVRPDGSVETAEARDFRHYCAEYDLTPEDLGKQVQINGQNLTIVGLKTRCRKYPIIARDDRGRGWKLPVKTVLQKLGR